MVTGKVLSRPRCRSHGWPWYSAGGPPFGDPVVGMLRIERCLRVFLTSSQLHSGLDSIRTSSSGAEITAQCQASSPARAMTTLSALELISSTVPPDSAAEDEGPFLGWLPPDDRLWRHPSEGIPVPDRIAVRARPRLSSGGRLWAMALLAGVIGALAASGIGAATSWFSQKTTVIRDVMSTTPPVSLAEAPNGPVNWTVIDDSIAPMVVNITVNGMAGPQIASGLLLGVSGVSGKAVVVTDRSLFYSDQSADYLGSIQITFLSGVKAGGHLIGQDRLSGLALLEVPIPVKVTPNIGSVSELRTADQVLAVGARNLSGGSVATGSVSGDDRYVNLPDGTELENLIAVTLPPLSYSATGGPILDQFGRVIGVTVNPDPNDTSDQGVAYAVPIDEVMHVVSQIIAGVAVTHAWLGVTNGHDLPSSIASQYGLRGGVQVDQIESGSPVALVGMKPHDIITEFDGQPVLSTGDLISRLNKLDPGHFAAITFIDDNRAIQTQVRLANER